MFGVIIVGSPKNYITYKIYFSPKPNQVATYYPRVETRVVVKPTLRAFPPDWQKPNLTQIWLIRPKINEP